MKYEIKQRIFSFNDSFTIKDENNESVLVVEGKYFTIGDKLKVLSPNNEELFYIEQQILNILPVYNIFSQGELVAEVKKELSFFKPKLNISSVYGNLRIEGNFMQYNYQIYNENNLIAIIDRAMLSFSDTYTLDVMTDTNANFLITLVIVIDMVLHNNTNR